MKIELISGGAKEEFNVEMERLLDVGYNLEVLNSGVNSSGGYFHGWWALVKYEPRADHRFAGISS